jgi:hypothetical protein
MFRVCRRAGSVRPTKYSSAIDLLAILLVTRSTRYLSAWALIGCPAETRLEDWTSIRESIHTLLAVRTSVDWSHMSISQCRSL